LVTRFTDDSANQFQSAVPGFDENWQTARIIEGGRETTPHGQASFIQNVVSFVDDYSSGIT